MLTLVASTGQRGCAGPAQATVLVTSQWPEDKHLAPTVIQIIFSSDCQNLSFMRLNKVFDLWFSSKCIVYQLINILKLEKDFHSTYRRLATLRYQCKYFLSFCQQIWKRHFLFFTSSKTNKQKLHHCSWRFIARDREKRKSHGNLDEINWELFKFLNVYWPLVCILIELINLSKH